MISEGIFIVIHELYKQGNSIRAIARLLKMDRKNRERKIIPSCTTRRWGKMKTSPRARGERQGARTPFSSIPPTEKGRKRNSQIKTT